jgi:hypothetical protein
MAQLNFNARDVAPEASRDPIPAGVYLAHITESDVVATRTGGQMLKITHEILDGQCKGRKVWGNINIKNPSAEAERIGQAQLSALCHAVGVLDLRDSSMLHMIPVRVRVSIRPAGPDKNGVPRDAQNEIKGYEAAGGAQAQASFQQPAANQQAPQQSAPRPQAAAPDPAPWARRA